MDGNIAAFWSSKKKTLLRCSARGKMLYNVLQSCVLLLYKRLKLMRVGPLGVLQHMQGKLNKPNSPETTERKNTIIQLDTQRHLTAEYINHRRTGRRARDQMSARFSTLQQKRLVHLTSITLHSFESPPSFFFFTIFFDLYLSNRPLFTSFPFFLFLRLFFSLCSNKPPFASLAFYFA